VVEITFSSTSGGGELPIPRIIRIGLRQFAAGMLSVLALGILNRVMKVELGLDLRLVGLVIGIHYFAAPLAIPFGHRSDRHPLFGLHRTPYIILGTSLSVVATLAAPFAAFFMADSQASALSIAAASAVFLLLGTGIYTAGTSYLSLIADLTTVEERGKVVSVVWSMMMIGILVGVFLGTSILDHYSRSALTRLFTLMAALVAGFTLLSVLGVERRERSEPQAAEPASSAWREILSSRQSRYFFVFLFSGILFLFIQNAVLEPFGGDVFNMSVKQTTLFNAFQMTGTLTGMAFAGGVMSKRWGDKLTAGVGLVIAALAFLLLGAASLRGARAWVQPAILVMGLGMGLFNVGGLALMMGMSVSGRTGAYMGAWTLSQALANGLASIGGGLLHDGALAAFGLESSAYALVFFVEALGLLATFGLLQPISLRRFRAESGRASVAVAEPL
jgi:BCD family chlorophyll transporter-like MFS transporter